MCVLVVCGRFFFYLEDLRKDEAYKEDDSGSEHYRQVGVERTVEDWDAHVYDDEQPDDYGHDGIGMSDALAGETEEKKSEHSAAENRRQFPPCVEDAVYLHHGKANENTDYSDNGGCHVKDTHVGFPRIIGPFVFVEFFIEAKDYRPYKLHVLFKNQSADPNNTIAEFLARLLMKLENFGIMTIVHSTNDVLRKSIGEEEFKKSKLLNDNSIKLRCRSKGFNDIAVYSIKGNKLCFTTTS